MKPFDNGYTIIGLDEDKKRVKRYRPKDYPIPKIEGINNYQIFVPRNFGSGKIGDSVTTTIIAGPNILCTETFVQIYPFINEEHAKNCDKYFKTNFFRILLSIRKQDQGASREVYQFIPLQDFTEKSDIDWNKSIPEIDRQLYNKYNLTEEEIGFIEKMIKPMD